MKKYFPLFLIVLLFLSVTAACAQAEPEEVTFYLTEYVNDIVPAGSIHRTVYTYDDQWRQTTLTSYQNDQPYYRVDSAYSEDGLVITMTSSGSGIVNEVSTYRRTLDENGRTIRLDLEENGELVTSTTYTYDAQGRQTSNTTLQYLSFADHSETTMSYDKNGNRTRVESTITYSDGTEQTSRTEYTYDRNNHRTSQTEYANGIVSRTIEYSYDTATNVETGIISGADGKESGKWITTYDSYGNQLKLEAYGPDGEIQFRQLYSYIGTDGTVSSGIDA